MNGSGQGGANSTPNVCSRYEHPGHDRIARELHDLRQRENEIRGRWKEMGYELPPICSDNETPFTLPAPISSDVTAQRPAHINLVSSHSRDAIDGLSAFETMSVSSETSTSSSQNVAGTPTTADRYSSIKVRPFEDPDETAESERRPAWTAYSPLDETPIQKEIRHAAEREHSLRQMRGLKPVESRMTPSTSASNGVQRHQSRFVDEVSGSVYDGSRSEASDEVVLRNGDASKSTSGRLSMRNFASARLQLEIEREKERELDLVRLGCIRTTSVDHIAPLASDDVDLSTKNVGTNGDSANRCSYVGAISSQFEQTRNESNGDTQPRRASRGVEKDTVGKSNGSATTTKRWSTSGPIVHRPETDGQLGGVGGLQPRHSVTSEMIERELRELEVRERELRMQRSDSSVNDFDSDNGFADNHLNGMTSSSSVNDVTHPRNRLSCALIDQWEDRTAKQ